ncbi:uncharacterized protein [Solanum lycopersicum]|uniref:Uncharacterized protein n=1 Tax=Solanum lycopersicum TaxID=4081 RepID=A0A3Q7ESM2_SOLLC|nr:uncharacterized protein LOC101259990 [Solanum lycopersicum]
MSEHKKGALFRYKSWSPDIQREEVWLKRRKKHFQRLDAERRSLSHLTAERLSSSLSADEIRHLSLSNTDEPRSLSFTADERRSLSFIADELRLMSLSKGDERRSLSLIADELRSMSLSKGDEQHERRSFSLSNGDERRTFSLSDYERRLLSLSADERRSLSLSADEDRRHSMSITNDDVDELGACFELGFGFDSNSDLDPKLTKAFPALELYHAVNKISRSSSSVSTVTSDGETPSSVETSVSIVEPGADEETMKLKLKQWAKVVGLSVLPPPSISK